MTENDGSTMNIRKGFIGHLLKEKWFFDLEKVRETPRTLDIGQVCGVNTF